jgi:hypothetical protein
MKGRKKYVPVQKVPEAVHLLWQLSTSDFAVALLDTCTWNIQATFTEFLSWSHGTSKSPIARHDMMLPEEGTTFPIPHILL